MTSAALRLSPSGPVITNPGGGTLTPGSGMQLRLAEAGTSVGATTGVIDTTIRVIGNQVIAAVNPTQLVVSLPTPQQARNYRATLLCDVENTLTTANVDVELGIQTSGDEGVTWTTISKNKHTVSFSTDTQGGARQIRVDIPLTSGLLFGVGVASASIKVRGIVTADKAGAILVSETDPTLAVDPGTVLLQLMECF